MGVMYRNCARMPVSASLKSSCPLIRTPILRRYPTRCLAVPPKPPRREVCCALSWLASNPRSFLALSRRAHNRAHAKSSRERRSPYVIWGIQGPGFLAGLFGAAENEIPSSEHNAEPPFLAQYQTPLPRALCGCAAPAFPSSPQFNLETRVGFEFIDDFVVAIHQTRDGDLSPVGAKFPELVEV
jgi:hypothetical protein